MFLFSQSLFRSVRTGKNGMGRECNRRRNRHNTCWDPPQLYLLVLLRTSGQAALAHCGPGRWELLSCAAPPDICLEGPTLLGLGTKMKSSDLIIKEILC